jgi:hypothetical protein
MISPDLIETIFAIQKAIEAIQHFVQRITEGDIPYFVLPISTEQSPCGVVSIYLFQSFGLFWSNEYYPTPWDDRFDSIRF